MKRTLNNILNMCKAERVVFCDVVSRNSMFSGSPLYEIEVKDFVARSYLEDNSKLLSVYPYFLFLDFLTDVFVNGKAEYTINKTSKYSKSCTEGLQEAATTLEVKRFYNYKITNTSFISLHLNHEEEISNLSLFVEPLAFLSKKRPTKRERY